MMDETTRLNQSTYDRIAARFAERNAALAPEIIEAAGRMLERMAAFHPDPPRMLDLGCGAGRDMAWFEQSSAQVVGVDLSNGMLAEARKRVRGPLAQMDMLHLGFGANGFNGVWCQAALLHLPKALAPAALAEMARVLVAGGWLYLSVQKGQSEGIETRAYEPEERYYAYYQPEELAQQVRSAGFTILQLGERQDRRPWLWLEAQLERAE